MRTFLLTIALCVTAFGQAACSERDQALTSVEPWDSPEAGGVRADWQADIKSRMRNQTEYDNPR
jgi:hypothetical protein